uniref:non-specific serine/threonine protein kinase n=1 Tax=Nicotiana benthamiana TaxID=4100 RepID=A0A0K1U1Y5_NICBE|nr:clade XVI lectin receptor kinase [Nicotiana benthamiana]
MRLLTPKLNTIFIFFCCLHSISQAKLKKFEKQYGNFDHTYIPFLEIKEPAQISNQALQVTPDTANSHYNMFNNSGRILLKQSFKLWEGDTSSKDSRVASFNSSFLVNIYRLDNKTAAEGLTFLITPDLDLPPNSQGQYLGLTNATTDGKFINRILAVELDTFQQDFDIDDNHIGIDIHSIKSIRSESLAKHGIELAPIGARFYNIWVQYDGIKKVLDVYIAEQDEKNGATPPRPKDPILSHDLDLRDFVNQESYFGFSASTGNFNQLNCVLRWNFTVEYFQEKNQSLTLGLGVGVPLFVLFLILVVYLGYYCYKKRVARSESNIVGALKSLPGMPRDFEFKVLKNATDNFDEKNKLGEGGFGVVYKGYLVGENLEIAVKWFSRESMKGQDDFLAELTIINRLRHKHLVKLLGWSHKHGKLILVFEYMPNGSLDKHLFSGPDKKPLSWQVRYKIVSGVASALHYLHDEFEQKVVHRDLKASNIMLDTNFNARLGDFGLARALDHEKTSYAESEGVLGTMGYIAPECFHTGKATQHSDVYAFGAVLLELVCGQRPGTKVNGFQLFADWVWYLHRDGRILETVDTSLGDDYVAEEAKRLLLLALACSHPIASERPKTQTIVQIISGSVPAPEVPPFKPAFVWPSMVPMETDIDSSLVDTISITTPQFSSGNNSVEYRSK